MPQRDTAVSKEKAFSSISITEITSRAGVSRSAYYRNYPSGEDILTNIFNRAAGTIFNGLSIVQSLVSQMKGADQYV